MSHDNFDVIIVGAGPSGAMAAYELAFAGYKVGILEKESFPRYKTCGGGVVFRARKNIPFDIGQIVEREFFHALFRVNGKEYCIQREIPIISMVMRAQFDELLIQKAIEKGAILIDSLPADGFIPGNFNQIKTKKGNFRAQYFIAADGVYSPMGKWAGIPDHRFLIPALECEVYIDPVELKNYVSQVIFDVDIIEQGYGWIFPKKDHLSIGVASFKRGKLNLLDIYRKFLKKWEITGIAEEFRHGYQIPVSPRGYYSKGNIFLVGDAAGLADPIVAEGISNAIQSGKLAAKAIIQDDCDCVEHGKKICRTVATKYSVSISGIATHCTPVF